MLLYNHCYVISPVLMCVCENITTVTKLCKKERKKRNIYLIIFLGPLDVSRYIYADKPAKILIISPQYYVFLPPTNNSALSSSKNKKIKTTTTTTLRSHIPNRITPTKFLFSTDLWKPPSTAEKYFLFLLFRSIFTRNLLLFSFNFMF